MFKLKKYADNLLPKNLCIKFEGKMCTFSFQMYLCKGGQERKAPLLNNFKNEHNPMKKGKKNIVINREQVQIRKLIEIMIQ